MAGWAWNTRLTVRLGVGARLADGTEYENDATQSIRLRWGRMVEDTVQEDLSRLRAAVERQVRAGGLTTSKVRFQRRRVLE